LRPTRRRPSASQALGVGLLDGVGTVLVGVAQAIAQGGDGVAAGGRCLEQRRRGFRAEQGSVAHHFTSFQWLFSILISTMALAS
jgi:hypothetical protein